MRMQSILDNIPVGLSAFDKDLKLIAACSVITAPLGASAAHSLPVKPLKKIFASILYLLAAYMLYRGLSRQ